MTLYSALDAVSAAIYSTLHVAGFLALSTGGVCDDVAQSTGYPFTLYSVQETVVPTFGTKPGTGRVIEARVRLQVFSQYAGFIEAQRIVDKALQLLADPPTVTGLSSWAIFHDQTVPVDDSFVAGQKVKELVCDLRLMVEGA